MQSFELYIAFIAGNILYAFVFYIVIKYDKLNLNMNMPRCIDLSITAIVVWAILDLYKKITCDVLS